MPSQIIHLSSNKPWKASFITESGLILYKAESHWHSIKISRAIPSSIGLNPNYQNFDTNSKDAYAHLAEIEYHTFHSSRIRYGGREWAVDEFFKKEGWSFFGQNRVFSGPDGRDYAWQMTSSVCKLIVNDSSKTPVAHFHRKKGGFIREARPAYLEVFEGGQHMLDLIVITFVYMEKLRKERADSAAASG